VAERKRDLLPVLAFLTRNLFPFNYVVPGESRNDIIKLWQLLNEEPLWRPLTQQLDYDFQIAEETVLPENPFSAKKFRMTNIVFDLPLRVDRILKAAGIKTTPHFANIVFQLIEFQLFDKTTFEENEQGASSHETYKNRQKWKVINRLMYSSGPWRGRTPFSGGIPGGIDDQRKED